MHSLRVAGLVILAASLAACVARPTGDFGRAAPSVLHDTVYPAAGRFVSTQREIAVSDFNQTDQEREMHDRTWRFLVAASADDWMFDSATELARARIALPDDFTFGTERYYAWLKARHYQSSTVRYSTLAGHIQADIDTLPTTFAAICAVLEIDRQRAIALSELTNLAATSAADVAARRSENQRHIAWFTHALSYRYQSYSYALDNLLVETPHNQSVAVDGRLRQLAPWVERARRGDFCLQPGSTQYTTVTIPSRFQTMVTDSEVIAQK